jgi:hypothetical protein
MILLAKSAPSPVVWFTSALLENDLAEARKIHRGICLGSLVQMANRIVITVSIKTDPKGPPVPRWGGSVPIAERVMNDFFAEEDEVIVPEERAADRRDDPERGAGGEA